MTNPMKDDCELEQQIKQMFASAWQDGVNHLNPKYLRRDSLFTDKVMQLIQSHTAEAVLEARLDELSDMPTYYGLTETQTVMLKQRLAELRKEQESGQ